MLWMEGPLSFLEQLCIISSLNHRHRVVLYHYGAVENVPPGVELADAAEVLPREGDGLVHSRTGSPALHSARFRYLLLQAEPGIIWADTDAYCLQPFVTSDDHLHGWESETHVNGGVLALPADRATLEALMTFTSDPFAIPRSIPLICNGSIAMPPRPGHRSMQAIWPGVSVASCAYAFSGRNG